MHRPGNLAGHHQPATSDKRAVPARAQRLQAPWRRTPGLQAQFAPRDRWLSFASLAACLLASATWTAIVAPGLGGGITLAALIAAGLTAAVYRTVTRPPLDYSGPLVPTPFGDYPLDLWRQVLRGPLLLSVLIAVTAAITAR